MSSAFSYWRMLAQKVKPTGYLLPTMESPEQRKKGRLAMKARSLLLAIAVMLGLNSSVYVRQ
jgi:hypothetical protein